MILSIVAGWVCTYPLLKIITARVDALLTSGGLVIRDHTVTGGRFVDNNRRRSAAQGGGSSTSGGGGGDVRGGGSPAPSSDVSSMSPEERRTADRRLEIAAAWDNAIKAENLFDRDGLLIVVALALNTIGRLSSGGWRALLLQLGCVGLWAAGFLYSTVRAGLDNQALTDMVELSGEAEEEAEEGEEDDGSASSSNSSRRRKTLIGAAEGADDHSPGSRGQREEEEEVARRATEKREFGLRKRVTACAAAALASATPTAASGTKSIVGSGGGGKRFIRFSGSPRGSRAGGGGGGIGRRVFTHRLTTSGVVGSRASPAAVGTTTTMRQQGSRISSGGGSAPTIQHPTPSPRSVAASTSSARSGTGHYSHHSSGTRASGSTYDYITFLTGTMRLSYASVLLSIVCELIRVSAPNSAVGMRMASVAECTQYLMEVGQLQL